MKIRIKHVSGKRPEYDYEIDNLEGYLMYIGKKDNKYYLLNTFEILNPEVLPLERIELIDFLYTILSEIEEIKLQNINGRVRTVSNPTINFSFDGVHLIYDDCRVVEIDGKSMVLLEGGANYMHLMMRYGIVADEIDIIEFPKYKEKTLTIIGKQLSDDMPITIIIGGNEVNTVWKSMLYLNESKVIHLPLNSTVIEVTTINGRQINPKKLYQKYDMGVMNV